MIIYMDRGIFGGIGGDADGIINKNTNSVLPAVLNLCDGFTRIGNRVYSVNVKENVDDYYSLKQVDYCLKINNQYVLQQANQNPIIYDSNDDEKVIIIKKSNTASSGNVYKPDGKLKEIDDLGQVDIINNKLEVCRQLDMKMKEFNEVFSEDGLLDNYKFTENMMYNNPIAMMNGFVYFGSYWDMNDRCMNLNGSDLNNPYFCQVGCMLEFYPDFLLKKLNKGIRSSVCSQQLSFDSNYNQKFVILKLFVKFDKLWFSVSVDLRALLYDIIQSIREFNFQGTQNQENSISMSSFINYLSSLKSNLKTYLLILRTFSIGFEIFDVLFELSTDFVSSSIGVSAYKNLYYYGC